MPGSISNGNRLRSSWVFTPLTNNSAYGARTLIRTDVGVFAFVAVTYSNRITYFDTFKTFSVYFRYMDRRTNPSEILELNASLRDRKKTSLYLSKDVYKQLRFLCKKHHAPISRVLESIILKFLNESGLGEKKAGSRDVRGR